MQRDRLSEEAPYSEEMRQSELHEKKRMLGQISNTFKNMKNTTEMIVSDLYQ
jgi:hypothetical protein